MGRFSQTNIGAAIARKTERNNNVRTAAQKAGAAPALRDILTSADTYAKYISPKDQPQPSLPQSLVRGKVEWDNADNRATQMCIPDSNNNPIAPLKRNLSHKDLNGNTIRRETLPLAFEDYVPYEHPDKSPRKEWEQGGMHSHRQISHTDHARREAAAWSAEMTRHAVAVRNNLTVPLQNSMQAAAVELAPELNSAMERTAHLEQVNKLVESSTQKAITASKAFKAAEITGQGVDAAKKNHTKIGIELLNREGALANARTALKDVKVAPPPPKISKTILGKSVIGGSQAAKSHKSGASRLSRWTGGILGKKSQAGSDTQSKLGDLPKFDEIPTGTFADNEDLRNIPEMEPIPTHIQEEVYIDIPKASGSKGGTFKG